ncbi:ParB/RepB/Spo0J family partition protein [Candidatus Parcubacteria bacterium]|nr:MAG: ParB/RepB/Spo0J family partition protein [Candidatus Parcubacteria bacterium]
MTAIIEKNINTEDAINENIHTETPVKNLFKNKIEKIISLHINRIQISEFMTRSQAIDEKHVQKLMDAIQEEGYLPGGEVWVNAITGTDGQILHYRLIAGRHRLEACRRLGMKEIPTLIFRDLTAMEECIADRVSNQKSSRHKKVSYLEEAMHCLYLHEKGWGIRQIAHAKNISKTAVARKINIAQLPKSVLDISVTVPSGTPISETKIPESHLESICKLKAEPHQILVCKKILGEDTDDSIETSEQPEKKIIPASEIKKMVRELKLTEAQGKLAAEAVKYIRDEKIDFTSISVKTEEEAEAIIVRAEEEAWQKILENIFTDESEKREKGMRYSTSPMWFKHCKSGNDLPWSSFVLLQELISSDFRYKPDRDKFFFITHGDCFKNTEDYLARVADVNERTLLKKVLPSIEEYVDYRKPGDVLKFRVNWDRLLELYKSNAYCIPFNDGGLAGIPEGYTGKVHPTPYHCLHIENGRVKQIASEDKTASPDLFQEEVSPAHTPKIPAEPEIKDRLKAEPEVKVKVHPVAEIESAPELKPEVIPEQQTEEQKEEETLDTADTACQIQEQDTTPEQEAEIEEVTEEARETARILRDAGMGKVQIDFCVSRRNIETALNILKYLSEMTPQEKASIKNIPGYIFKMVRDGFTPPPGFVSYREVQEKTERKRTVKLVSQTVRQAFEAGTKVFFSPKDEVFYPIETISGMTFTYRHPERGRMGGTFTEWPSLEYFGEQRE